MISYHVVSHVQCCQTDLRPWAMLCWVWRQLWRRRRRCVAEGKISDTGKVVGPQWIWRVGSYRNTEILFRPTDLLLMIVRLQSWIMQCRGFIMVYHFSMRGLWKRRHARRVNVWSVKEDNGNELMRWNGMRSVTRNNELHKIKICVH